MTNYVSIEEQLNEEAKRILVLIKKDYYNVMSEEKREVLDSLLNGQVVIVNQGVSIFNDNTLAHGGRTLRDRKVHFYPDVREFNSDEEIIGTCKRLLPHECFHYFIQPDAIRLKDNLEKEMASFYTEGLVEREARKFSEKYGSAVPFEKANYGYNINFVNRIQNSLHATDYTVIFSENDYIKGIGRYFSEYSRILRERERDLNLIREMVQDVPIDLRKRVQRKMRTIALQNGGILGLKEKLEELGITLQRNIENLEQSDEDREIWYKYIIGEILLKYI